MTTMMGKIRGIGAHFLPPKVEWLNLIRSLYPPGLAYSNDQAIDFLQENNIYILYQLIMSAQPSSLAWLGAVPHRC